MVSFLLTLARFFKGLYRAWLEPNFRSTLVVAVMLLVSGTIFYSKVEGWAIFDSLYFCVMTLTTIGYGDFHPSNSVSKAFTMIYAIVGIGVFVALITQIAKAQIESDK